MLTFISPCVSVAVKHCNLRTIKENRIDPSLLSKFACMHIYIYACTSFYQFAFIKKCLYIRLECGKLSRPRYHNGEIDLQIGEDGFSEIATFNCAPGYYVSGSSALHCEKGVWDGREPECKREYYLLILLIYHFILPL